MYTIFSIMKRTANWVLWQQKQWLVVPRGNAIKAACVLSAKHIINHGIFLCDCGSFFCYSCSVCIDVKSRIPDDTFEILISNHTLLGLPNHISVALSKFKLKCTGTNTAVKYFALKQIDIIEVSEAVYTITKVVFLAGRSHRQTLKTNA